MGGGGGGGGLRTWSGATVGGGGGWFVPEDADPLPDPLPWVHNGGMDHGSKPMILGFVRKSIHPESSRRIFFL